MTLDDVLVGDDVLDDVLDDVWMTVWMTVLDDSFG